MKKIKYNQGISTIVALIIVVVAIAAGILIGTTVKRAPALEEELLFVPTEEMTEEEDIIEDQDVDIGEVTQNNSDQADWYIPNQIGWVIKTLDWKKYSIDDSEFFYPSNYIVKTEKFETRFGSGSFYDQITIFDPDSRSDTDDRIFIGIPNTGANDPYAFYEIRENINNSGVTLSIAFEASNFAKYIFENIVASVN